MKIKSPFGKAVKVPLPGITAEEVNVPVIPAMVNCVITKVVLPSGSESLVNTFTVTGVSSGVTLLSSFTAIGLSLVAEIVIFKFPMAVPPCPSLIV